MPAEFTLDDVAVLLAIALIAGASYMVTRWLLRRLVLPLVNRANADIAARVEQVGLLPAVALLAPAVVIALTGPWLAQRLSWAGPGIRQIFSVYVVVVLALIVDKLLNVLSTHFSHGRDESVAGSLQTVFRWLRIANVAVASVLALGIFANIQVTWILAAIGLVATAGSIVFGDMIYNSVSRVLLKSQKLVREGDWLEVPGLQVNGEVKEVGSVLVLVQNWDNSLATVPPRYLINNSFRNWQQMYRTGQRRIMRRLYLDITTVRPMDGELLAAARAQPVVAAFLEGAQDESGAPLKPETMTNAAVYRHYLMAHLHAHPSVTKENTIRVTNEDSLGNGLPVLLLAYSTQTADIPFRMLESELYEFAVAAAPGFGLEVYQMQRTVEGRREAEVEIQDARVAV